MVDMWVQGRSFDSRYGHLISVAVDIPATIRGWKCDAAHEAGHAVIGLAEGLHVNHAEVHDRGGGRTDFTFDLESSFTKRQMMYAAGERAADRYMREHGLWTPEVAVSIEVGAYTDRQNYGWRDIHDTVDRLLDEHWGSVVAVTDALGDAGHLSGGEIADVINGVMDVRVEIT